jgi:hypothetical protein
MSAAAIVALFSSLLGLVEGLVPTIQALVKGGQISVADQAILKARIDSLRAKVNSPGPLVDDGMDAPVRPMVVGPIIPPIIPPVVIPPPGQPGDKKPH